MNGRRLAILAGGGELPREIALGAAARGVPVSIVAIDGEADAAFGELPVTRVNWGQIGAMIRALKAGGPADLVIVGRVRRPELKGLKPDLGFFRHLPSIVRIIASGGDDSVLRRVVRFFEAHGLRVVSPGAAAPELLVREGPLGAARLAAGDPSDIQRGLELIRALGPYDIGQSVIVDAGRIEAIEGVEGTDRMIARAGERRAARHHGSEAARSGVLVKRSKPGQDLRVDMPTIGPATVEGAAAAGLVGLAVEADTVLVAERAQTLAEADRARLFVEGVRDRAPPAGVPPRFDPQATAIAFRAVGALAPKQHATHDAIKGLATLDALAPFACGRAAVVVRNHVLAVEAGDEGVAATLARAAGLRPWASITRHRRGVLAVRHAGDVTPAVLDAVAAGGYAGIVVGEDTGDGPAAGAERIAAAERDGVFVLVRQGAGEGTR